MAPDWSKLISGKRALGIGRPCDLKELKAIEADPKCFDKMVADYEKEKARAILGEPEVEDKSFDKQNNIEKLETIIAKIKETRGEPGEEEMVILKNLKKAELEAYFADESNFKTE